MSRSNKGKGRNSTVETVMSRHQFARGYADFMAGKGFSDEYDRMNQRDQFNYERGRQFAAGTNGSVPYKNGKKVTEEAFVVGWDMFCNKEIL